MTLDYFYGQAGELFSFYRIPKALFQEPRFQSLSTDAKTLYGILLDRMSLFSKIGIALFYFKKSIARRFSTMSTSYRRYFRAQPHDP